MFSPQGQMSDYTPGTNLSSQSFGDQSTGKEKSGRRLKLFPNIKKWSKRRKARRLSKRE